MDDETPTEIQLTPLSHPMTTLDTLDKRLYTVPDLMRVTKMTRKQVVYWAKIGIVRPIFRNDSAAVGQPASFYAATEVLKALIICELRRANFSLRQVQQVVRNLQEHGIELYDAEAYLLTDGYSVYYAYSENEVVDILKHQRQMLLLVPMHEQVAKLKEAA